MLAEPVTKPKGRLRPIKGKGPVKKNATPQAFQDCVNEAVTNYLDNVLTQRGTPAATLFTSPQIPVTTPVAPPVLHQISGPPIRANMPVFAAVVPAYVPPAASIKPDLENFINTGLDVLKDSLPKNRAASACSRVSMKICGDYGKPPTSAVSLQQSLQLHRKPMPKPPLSPKKAFQEIVRHPTPKSAASCKSVKTPPKSPLKHARSSETDRIHSEDRVTEFVNRGSSPFNIKNPKTLDGHVVVNGAKEKESKELSHGKTNRDGPGYDWHWSVWKENTGRNSPVKIPSSRPPSPPKPLKSSAHRRPSSRTPAATPFKYDFSKSLDIYPTPDNHQASIPFTTNGMAVDKASPYEHALKSWAKNATDYDKSVVYDMMKTLNTTPMYSASRVERARSSMHDSRPVSPVRMTKYTTTSNGSKPAGVQTSVPIYGRPQVVEFVPTNENAMVNNYYQKLLENARQQTDVSPYFTQRETRPMSRHKPKPALQKEYIHQGSFFCNSQVPFRTNFTIHPDWVSERRTLRVTSARH